MGRNISCDHCKVEARTDTAEDTWFRLNHDATGVELWFCSAGCIIDYVTEHQETLGVVDDDDID